MIKNRILMLAAIFSGFISSGLHCVSVPPLAQEEMDLAVLEKYLRTARVENWRPDENLGRTEPWRIDLNDGVTPRKARFKHVRRCRPNINPDCYKYELAAYELSKLLDLKIIPPTVERVIEDIPGALQLQVEGCKSLQSENIAIKDQDKFYRALLDIMVFENLVYCYEPYEDVNEDILVNLETGKVCRVDFSRAFSLKHTLIPEREVFHCSDRLLKTLKNLQDEAISETLEPFLIQDEIQAVIARKNLLLAQLKASR